MNIMASLAKLNPIKFLFLHGRNIDINQWLEWQYMNTYLHDMFCKYLLVGTVHSMFDDMLATF